MGSFKYGSAFHVPEHETRIYGTKGVAIIDFKNSCVRIHDADGNDEVVRLHATDIENETQMAQYTNPSGGAAHGKPSSVPPAYLLDAVDRLLHTFIETLRTGCIEPEFEALFGGEAGRSSVAACEAAVKSAKTNRLFAWPDDRRRCRLVPYWWSCESKGRWAQALRLFIDETTANGAH